jgi:hypothetical protein
VSLRMTLTLLPDDRATNAAVREVIAFFRAHAHEPVEPSRVARATGLSADRVDPVLQALARGRVIDCDGDPLAEPSSFDPDTMLAMEVRRFLGSSDRASSRIQAGVDRYRGRQGPL